MDQNDSNQFFIEKILSFTDDDDIENHEQLNQLELCLLVDVCIKKGNSKQK
jgi:hypothetical protein